MNIGIDFVSVGRFRKIRRSDHTRWKRVFTRREWAYAFRDVRSAQHLAGMFAAKEAAIKALNLPRARSLNTIEVRHDKTGAPSLSLPRSRVSISHAPDAAVAVVLLL